MTEQICKISPIGRFSGSSSSAIHLSLDQYSDLIIPSRGLTSKLAESSSASNVPKSGSNIWIQRSDSEREHGRCIHFSTASIPRRDSARDAVLSGTRHRRTIWHVCRQTLSYAIALLHFVVPTLHARAIIRNLHFQRMTKVHNGDCRYVRD